MPIRSTWTLIVLLSTVGGIVFGRASELTAAEDSQRPNIVMLLVDDLGWTDLACYGSDLHETPNIDRLATQSLKFTNAYAAASICSPTRAAWMTGKTPARLHMTVWHEYAVRGPNKNRKMIPPNAIANLPLDEVTLAEVLQAAGYLTAHIGKWHLGNAEHYAQTQGFDADIGGTLWGAPATYFYPYRGFWSNSRQIRYVPHLEFGQEGEYLTDRLTDEALKIVDAAGHRPFFLNLCFHTVHTPIEGKPALVKKYEQKLEPGLRHRHPGYAAMVHSLDENVGRLLKGLDERGVADNTLVIFTSDNGGYVSDSRYGVVTTNAPLRSGKGSLYEGGIRVPLLIRWPGHTPSGSTCVEPVSTQDFYPTLLEILDLSGDANHNASVDGTSFAALLDNPQATLDRSALYWHYPHYYSTTTPVSAIRSGDWKLLEYYEDGRVELYNLQDDLGEQTNLAKKHADRAQALRSQLHDWLSDVNAQLPRPNPSH